MKGSFRVNCINNRLKWYLYIKIDIIFSLFYLKKMDKLPTIVNHDICLKLPLSTIYNIFLTNKKLALISNSNYFWYCKFFNDFKEHKSILNLLSLNDVKCGDIKKEMGTWKIFYKLFYEQVKFTLSQMNESMINSTGEYDLFKNLNHIERHMNFNYRVFNEMKNWFTQLFPNPHVHNYIFDYIASCFLKKPISSVPIIYGVGNNGKSTFILFINSVFSLLRQQYSFFYVNDDNDLTLINSIIENSICSIGETHRKCNIDDSRLIKGIKIETVYGHDFPLNPGFNNYTNHFVSLFYIFIIPFCMNHRLNNKMEIPEIINEMTTELLNI